MANQHFPNVAEVFCGPGMSIRDTMGIIDSGGAGIALLVDERRRLVTTISDGDIRRAILAGHSLDETVSSVIESRPLPHQTSVSASVSTPAAELLALMREHGVQQIPLVDSEGRVIDLVLMRTLHEEFELPLKAVLMAGGFGTRLRPLTETIPKPMLPVNGTPLLELTINRLRGAGIRKVSITTHYLPEVITSHLGDGAQFGVELNYVNEETPLGTAGALSLMEVGQEPLLVMNGDIVTDLDFGAMLEFHRHHKAMLTVAMAPYEYEIPYGVVDHRGSDVIGIREKPREQRFINAGIYLVEAEARQHIPSGTHFSMVDLIEWLLRNGHRVAGFPIREYWLDIGRHDDYVRAQTDAAQGRLRFPIPD